MEIEEGFVWGGDIYAHQCGLIILKHITLTYNWDGITLS